MEEAALHITFKRAGDPEMLGALLNAAFAAQERPEPVTKIEVPNGYRCVECYAEDGGHEKSCSIGMSTHRQELEGTRAT